MSTRPLPHSPASGAHGPSHVAAVALALTDTVLWSSSWILIRWGLDDEALEPLGFAALRYGVASAVLWAWIGSQPAVRATVRTVDGRSAGHFVIFGLVFYAATQGRSSSPSTANQRRPPACCCRPLHCWWR